MKDKPTTDELTVLDDFSHNGESSHREIAQALLPQLKEEMPEDEYRVEFHSDIQGAVLKAIINDLSANARHEDWNGYGFEEPADFLDAEAVSDVIGELSEWYFKDDQIGKSWDVMQVIFEYAEEYDLVERKDPE